MSSAQEGSSIGLGESGPLSGLLDGSVGQLSFPGFSKQCGGGR